MEKMKNLSKNRFLTLVITLCLSAVLFLSGLIVFAVNRDNDDGGAQSGSQGGNNATTIYVGSSYQLKSGDNLFEFTPNVSRTYKFSISGYNKTVEEFFVYNNGSQTYSSTSSKASYSIYLSYGTTYEIQIDMDIYSSGYANLSVSES